MTQDCLKQRRSPLVAAGAAAAAAVVMAAAVSLSAQAGGGPTVAVAAASDLQTVLPQLLQGFQKATAIRPTIAFGSSGSLFAQIQNGAPFDVFFSADLDYPRRLVAAGRADADSLYRYATGRLVLWTRTDSGLDIRTGLALLRDPRVRRIAVANPDFAPYGRAAVAALKSGKLYDQVKGKLVFGENISQAAQLAQSGNADVGLLGHSLALSDALKASGAFIEVPADSYPPVIQAAVIVSASKNKDAARALLRYLKGADAQRTLAASGFTAPSAP
jgi:molybdate transport system substrate-binding protein